MFDKKLIKISILIPCFNENNTINLIIDRVIKSLEVYNFTNYEIIIVDDFSNDGTRDKLKKLKTQDKIKIFYHSKNLGKGAAIKTAIAQISGDIAIIQDADLEYDPLDYNRLLLPFFETDSDAVYGSRFLGGGKYVRVHFFWHYLANKILTFICNLFVNLNLTDMETGYKVFKTEHIKSIEIKENRFGFEPEITIKLAKKKLKFYEVGISYNGRSYDEGKKIGIKDAFRAIYCIFYYYFK